MVDDEDESGCEGDEAGSDAAVDFFTRLLGAGSCVSDDEGDAIMMIWTLESRGGNMGLLLDLSKFGQHNKLQAV